MGTAFLTAQKALDNGKNVIVLDRVNPIGDRVSGPLLNINLAGHTISYFRFPLAHGLSMGEILKFALRDNPNKSRLSIVENKGWHRNQIWEETGLTWTLPSPALPTYEQSYLYSVLGGMECLNISVGRSKTNKEAFKFYGAPWITYEEANQLVSRLNLLNLAGIEFQPIRWNVTRSTYNGTIANGFKAIITNFKLVERYEALYKVMQIFAQSFGKRVEYNRWCHRYLGDEIYLNFVKDNIPYESISSQIKADEYAFEKTIHAYRIYK